MMDEDLYPPLKSSYAQNRVTVRAGGRKVHASTRRKNLLDNLPNGCHQFFVHIHILHRRTIVAVMSVLLSLLCPRNGWAWKSASPVGRVLRPFDQSVPRPVLSFGPFCCDAYYGPLHLSPHRQFSLSKASFQGLPDRNRPSRQESSRLMWRSSTSGDVDEMLRPCRHEFSTSTKVIESMPFQDMESVEYAQGRSFFTSTSSDLRSMNTAAQDVIAGGNAERKDIGFRVKAPFLPTGDQPEAIRKLLEQMKDRCYPRAILRGRYDQRNLH